MIVAELASWMTDASAIAGVVVVVAGAFTVVTKARWIRFLWHQLVAEPVTRWQTAVVMGQVAPLRDDVAELRDQVAQSSADLVTHVRAEEAMRLRDNADRDRRQDEMDRWRTDVRDDVAEIKTGLGTVHRRIDSALQRLAEGNPEVRP